MADKRSRGAAVPSKRQPHPAVATVFFIFSLAVFSVVVYTITSSATSQQAVQNSQSNAIDQQVHQLSITIGQLAIQIGTTTNATLQAQLYNQLESNVTRLGLDIGAPVNCGGKIGRGGFGSVGGGITSIGIIKNPREYLTIVKLPSSTTTVNSTGGSVQVNQTVLHLTINISQLSKQIGVTKNSTLQRQLYEQLVQNVTRLGQLLGLRYSCSVRSTTTIQPTTSIVPLSSIVGTIFMRNSPSSIVYNPSNGYLYVTSGHSSTIAIVNGTSIVDNLTIGFNGILSSVYNPSNGYVYVLQLPSSGPTVNSTVSVINGTSVVSNITVGAGASSLAYDSSNGDVYVANGGNSVSESQGSVSIIKGTSVIAAITGLPYSVGGYTLYDPSNGNVYIATSYNGIYVINGTTLVGQVPGTSPTYLSNSNSFSFNLYYEVYDQSNGYVYAPTFGSSSNSVYVINGTSLVANITISGNGIGLPAYDPSNGNIYIPTSNSAPASSNVQINGANYQTNLAVVHDTAQVGDLPAILGAQYAAYDPSNGYIYVTGGSSIAVVNVNSPITVPTYIDVPSSGYGVPQANLSVYNPSNRYMYVPTGTGSLVVVLT